MAGDLRAVVSALKDVADMQRRGALATHIARIARRRHPNIAVPGDVVSYFAEMGRIAVRISQDTRNVVLAGNSEQPAQLRAEDEAMDDLHRHLFTRLMDPTWTHGTAAAVDVTLLSRYYERFADHAVEGRRPRHLPNHRNPSGVIHRQAAGSVLTRPPHHYWSQDPAPPATTNGAPKQRVDGTQSA